MAMTGGGQGECGEIKLKGRSGPRILMMAWMVETRKEPMLSSEKGGSAEAMAH